MKASEVNAAVDVLKAADPNMARAIEALGACTMRRNRDGTHFDHLVRAIVYQQVSGAAARTIHGRFKDQIGAGSHPTPEQVLSYEAEALRACGLSGAKTAAIQDLARHVVDGRLPMDRLHRMRDDDVIAALVPVRGIGVWTAQMFLMFRLGRFDVLPVLDLGVRKGAQRIYRMRTLPDAARLAKVARTWRPYASIASWYCWRAVDTDDGGTW
jgi:DNA-3-methyladenine glycosylase II